MVVQHVEEVRREFQALGLGDLRLLAQTHEHVKFQPEERNPVIQNRIVPIQAGSLIHADLNCQLLNCGGVNAVDIYV